MIFRRLLGFLRPYRGQVVASVLLAIASQICALAIPYLTGRSIDAATDGDRTLLLELAALIVALGALKGVLMFFRRWLAGRLSLAVEFDLRNRMYTHLQRLSYGFFDRHQTGQLMSRATVDLQAVRFFLGYGLIFFSQHVLTVVIVLIALSLLNVAADADRDRHRAGADGDAPTATRGSATRSSRRCSSGSPT